MNETIEQISYEQAFKELEEIVAALEMNNQSLETTLNLFERGQMLIRYCTNKLDQAELKIQQISGDELVGFSPDNREIS